VQDNTKERRVYLQPAVVFDEAHFSESIHEKIDARARGTNHFRQRLLRYFGKLPVDLILLAIAGEQQQRARQPFPLRANIGETSLVPLINEQGEKEKGGDERKSSWC
jgi:hypothetical protein